MRAVPDTRGTHHPFKGVGTPGRHPPGLSVSLLSWDISGVNPVCLRATKGS